MISLTWPALVLIVGLAMTAGRVGMAPMALGAKKAALTITHPVRHPKHDMKSVGHFFKGGKNATSTRS